MNETSMNGKWLEIKGELLKTWGKLTSDEVEQTKGDLTAIAGLVQQKYGEEGEKFKDQYAKILESVNNKKDSIVDSVKQNLKK